MRKDDFNEIIEVIFDVFIAITLFAVLFIGSVKLIDWIWTL